MSLRARLVLVVVGLVAAGLLVAGWATYHSLQSFLLTRVDQQLASVRPFDLQRSLDGGGGPGPGPEPQDLPTGTYLAELTDQGSVLEAAVVTVYGTRAPTTKPDIPPEYAARCSQGSNVLATVGSAGGSYRLLAQPTPDGNVFVTAIPLADTTATLNRLLALEALVGGLVLLGLALAAYGLIRVELRPLDRIGATAGKIAAGDLSRRVEPSNPRTEVGRLGLALNEMLAKIERAFAERSASEARVRQFVADASHELRTPLTSIRGYAELFHRGAAERPADLETAMRRIEQEAARMGVLVEDLLLLAHLDQDRPLERHPVQVAAVVGDAALDARAVAPDRSITVEAPEQVSVLGDELALRQAVANLVSNALVHTPAGTPIQLGARRRGGSVVVWVADHGPGVPPEIAQQVFERFYRADKGRSRARGGTGLGLSIVAAITAAHGGRARVGVTPGGGATFELELPAVTGPVGPGGTS